MTPLYGPVGIWTILTCRQFVDQGLEMLVVCARSHRDEVCSFILRSLRSGCLPVLHPHTEVWESLIDARLLTSSADTLDWDESYCEQSFWASLVVQQRPRPPPNSSHQSLPSSRTNCPIIAKRPLSSKHCLFQNYEFRHFLLKQPTVV